MRKALEAKDEAEVFALASEAIEATAAKLRPILEKELLAVVLASGKAWKAPKVTALRAAADIKYKFDVTNPRATEWAAEHAAWLIDGISETTREAIREEVEAAFEDQFDVRDLADRIEDLIGDASRAQTIARTETMTASNQGQLEAWEQAKEAGLLSGGEQKEWIVTPDDRLCPICEPMDGVNVGLDEKFVVNGEELDGPPAHPNCRCTIALTV